MVNPITIDSIKGGSYEQQGISRKKKKKRKKRKKEVLPSRKEVELEKGIRVVKRKENTTKPKKSISDRNRGMHQ